MCKNCEWSYHYAKDTTLDQINEAVRIHCHGLRDGFSGYGGAAWLFNMLMDDKETMDAIKGFIEHKITLEKDPLVINELQNLAELTVIHRMAMVVKIKELLE
jgi:hypothetical protein